MNKVRISFIALLVAFFTSGAASAQITAPFAAGLRGSPDGGGLNLRFFFNENFALEGQGNFSNGTTGGSGQALMGHVLMQYHYLFGDARFRMFLGAGAHYGTWERYKDVSVKDNFFGFDVQLGAEYVFASMPLGISIDAKPSFNYVSGVTIFPNNTFGLSLRYYFGAWEEYDSHLEDRRE